MHRRRLSAQPRKPHSHLPRFTRGHCYLLDRLSYPLSKCPAPTETGVRFIRDVSRSGVTPLQSPGGYSELYGPCPGSNLLQPPWSQITSILTTMAPKPALEHALQAAPVLSELKPEPHIHPADPSIPHHCSAHSVQLPPPGRGPA